MNIENTLKQGLAGLQAGRILAADRQFSAAVKAAPAHPQTNYCKGAVAAMVGEYEVALRFLQQAIESAPGYLGAWLKYIDLLVHLDRIDQARKSLTRARKAGLNANSLSQLEHELRKSDKVARQRAETQAVSRLNADYQQGRYSQVLKQGALALEQHPGSANVLFVMGAANAAQRIYDEATCCYQQVLRINPQSEAALQNLGAVMLELREIDTAIDLLDKVLTINPTNAGACLLRGNACRLRGDNYKAIEYYRRALVARPDYAEACNNIGTSLTDLGDNDGAIENYRRALALKPDYALAHRNLAYLWRYQGKESQLADMNRLYELKKLPDADRVQLGFALSKAYQDTKDLASAFELLCQANRLNKRILNYDFETDRKLFARIQELSTCEAPPEAVSTQPHDIEPVFIIGMPRSGTTLVEQIIASHSAVYAGGETGLFSQAIRKLNLLHSAPTPELLLRSRDLYLEELRKMGSSERIITDKTPLNFRWLDLILKTMPDAKVVHVMRDARAVCWSNFNLIYAHTGHGFVYDMRDLTSYYRMYVQLMDTWRKRYPGRIYDLSYEALTEDQEGQSRQLLDYLGLTWEPAVMDFYRNERSVSTASSQQVRQPIYRNSSDRWKQFAPYLDDMINALEGC